MAIVRSYLTHMKLFLKLCSFILRCSTLFNPLLFSYDKSFPIWRNVCMFPFLLIVLTYRRWLYTTIDEWAVVAVLFPVQEQSFKAVAEATFFVCETTAAIAGEIWVLV